MRTLLQTIACWLLLAGTANAADVMVTRTDDPAPDGCLPTDCSLREAVTAAQPGDRVRLLGDGGGAQVHELTRGTIVISTDLTLQGGGSSVSGIGGIGNNGDRLLKVDHAEVTIADVSFANVQQARDEVTSNNPLNHNGGAALFSDGGEVTLTRVAFESNSSPVMPGGAVSALGGTLGVTDTEFHAGYAYAGSALFVRGATVSVNRTTVSNGTNTRGAIYLASGTLAITNSTVTGNGLGNSVGGGVVNAGGTLTLANATLADNARGSLMTYDGATTQANNTLLGAGYGDTCVRVTEPNVPEAGPAITTDAGYNLASDTSCTLSASSSHVNAQLRLAPLADNGGRTHTMALLVGSPAIDAALICPPADQRDVGRAGACDVGAYEAERLGNPTATTGPVTQVGAHDATVTGEYTLAGEGGALRIDVGKQPGETFPYTTLGVGRISATRSVPLQGLDAYTTYYYRAVAINASGETPGALQQFRTDAAAPDVLNADFADITDTSASVKTTLSPNGPGTTYVITWTSAAGTGQSGPFDVGASSGVVEVARTISGLKPGTTYHVDVIATNAQGSSPGGLQAAFKTTQHLAAHVGQTVTVTEKGTGCRDYAIVEWGDGSRSGTTPVDCDLDAFTLTATHAYEKAGNFRILIEYDNDDLSEAFAAIAATLSVASSGPGRVTGAGIDCGSDCSETSSAGEPVTLTATPANGSVFDGWEGACTGTGTGTCTVTLDADRNVTARFSTPQPQVSPTPAPSAQPTPIPTPTATPEPPITNRTVVVEPSGTVLYKPKGAKKFIPLPAGSLPLGVQIDATNGRITITSIPKPGAPPETATFYGGIFTITQAGGITDLKLSGPEPTCKKQARAAAGKKVKSRKLWGEGKGAFRTTGKYSAATVRGTRWLVEDSCSGTLTRVVSGVVTVRDTVRGKTILLRAGKRYLARPRGR